MALEIKGMNRNFTNLLIVPLFLFAYELASPQDLNEALIDRYIESHRVEELRAPTNQRRSFRANGNISTVAVVVTDIWLVGLVKITVKLKSRMIGNPLSLTEGRITGSHCREPADENEAFAI